MSYFSIHLEQSFSERNPNAKTLLDAYDAAIPKAVSALQRVDADRQSGKLPLFTPYTETDPKIAAIQEKADALRTAFKHLVVIGTGGSTLCAQTLVGLTYPEELQPRLHFLDNIDPYTVHQTLDQLPLEQTHFLTVSKSGGTMETLSIAATVIERLRDRFGAEAIARHMTALTEAKPSALREIAEHFDLEMLEHEPLIGGRFSIFTNVALLPAAIAGLDITAFLHGARSYAEAAFQEGSEATTSAALHYATMQNQYPISVLMPYIDRLKHFSTWQRQIWAESLGKQGHGSTPISAIGTLDQHSQLQLFLDGPADKFFTLLFAKQSDTHLIQPENLPPASQSHLHHRSLGELLTAAQYATRDSLIAFGAPVRVIELNHMNEATLGALCMHFILETVAVGTMLGLDPFDQPAVEDGKLRAKEYLAKIERAA